MVWLASAPSRREAAGPLAERTKIPRRYLHKVLQSLVHGGLVDSISGPGGGYALCRPAEEITILDIVEAVAPLERIRRCPLGITSHTRLCPLHKELDRVYAEVEAAFQRVTLAALVRSTSKIVPLCEVGRQTQLAHRC